jgi:hypothetical protein
VRTELARDPPMASSMRTGLPLSPGTRPRRLGG